MTNQEMMANISAVDCRDVMDWLLHEYGMWHVSPAHAVIGWLKSEAIAGQCQKETGYVTAGGDPVWTCPKCGQDRYVYGIEHQSERRVLCRHCGCWNIYWEGKYASANKDRDA